MSAICPGFRCGGCLKTSASLAAIVVLGSLLARAGHYTGEELGALIAGTGLAAVILAVWLIAVAMKGS